LQAAQKSALKALKDKCVFVCKKLKENNQHSATTYSICVRKWFRLFADEEVFVPTKHFINTCKNTIKLYPKSHKKAVRSQR